MSSSKSVIVAGVNLGGQQGKSTVVKHLICPLLGLSRAEVETINEGAGDTDLSFSGKDFKDLAAKMNRPGAKLGIDIGASNVETVLAQFKTLKSAREKVDFWVIPTIPTATAKVNALKTIEALLDMEVPAAKIIVILNSIEEPDFVERDFAALLKTREMGVNVVSQAILRNDEVFSALRDTDLNVFDLVQNPPDFDTLWAEAGDDEVALDKVGRRQNLQDMAEACAANLKSVFLASPLPTLVTAE